MSEEDNQRRIRDDDLGFTAPREENKEEDSDDYENAYGSEDEEEKESGESMVSNSLFHYLILVWHYCHYGCAWDSFKRSRCQNLFLLGSASTFSAKPIGCCNDPESNVTREKEICYWAILAAAD